MPSTSLDTADAVELAELLQFPGDWLEADHGQLSASLARFTGSQAYGVEMPRRPGRFAFLPGGNDGEHLFLRRGTRDPWPHVHRTWTLGCLSCASNPRSKHIILCFRRTQGSSPPIEREGP